MVHQTGSVVMTDNFDPYRSWLGIRDTRRPPNHYRLLGIELFEDDPEVISNAADRQMSHIRTYQTGKHSEVSQRLLNELAVARVALLDAARKSAYDAQLRSEMELAAAAAAPSPPPPPVVAPPIPPPPPSSISKGSVAPPPIRKTSAAVAPPPVQTSPREAYAEIAIAPADDRHSAAGGMPWIAIGAAALVLVTLAIGGVALMSSGNGNGQGLAATGGTAEGTIAASSSTTTSMVSSTGAEGTRDPRPIPTLASTPLEVFGTSVGEDPRTPRTEGTRTTRPSLPARSAEVRTLLDGSREWTPHVGSVSVVGFSPSGKVMLSAADDGEIRVFRAKQCDEVARLVGNGSPIAAMAIARSGAVVASGTDAGTLHLWSLESNEQMFEAPAHTGAVRTVAFAPNGSHLVTGGDDGRMRLWDLSNLEVKTPVASWAAHEGGVSAAAIVADGAQIVSIGADGYLKIWNARRSELMGQVEMGEGIGGTLAVSASGNQAFVGANRPRVMQFDLTAVQRSRVMRVEARRVRSLSLAPSGNAILVSSDDSIGIYRLQGETELYSWNLEGVTITSLALAPDASQILCGLDDGTLKTWATPPDLVPQLQSGGSLAGDPDRIPVGIQQDVEAHAGAVRQIVYGPGERWVASAGNDGTIRVFETSSFERVARMPGHPGGTTALAFYKNGERLVSAGADQRIRIWELPSGKEIGALSPAPSRIEQIFLLDDGALWTVEADRTVRRIDLDTTQTTASFTAATYGERFAFADDGSLAVSTGLDLGLRRWQPAAEAKPESIGHCPDLPYALALQVARQELCIGDASGRILLWKLGNPSPSMQLVGHVGVAEVLAISARTSRLASGGTDGILRIWDLESGQLVTQFEQHQRPITALAISADGRLAISGDAAGRILSWGLPALESLRPNPEAMIATPTSLPVPESSAIAARQKELRELFKVEYAKRNAAGQIALASKLLEESERAAAAPDLRYVLLTEAVEQATLGGDADRAMYAIDQLATSYGVDAATLKVDTLTQLSRNTQTPELTLTAATRTLELLESLCDRDQYDLAIRLAKVGEAYKSAGPAFVAMAQLQGKRIRLLQKEYERLKKSRDALAADSASGEANLEIGKFLCYQKEDWDQGLRQLAIGSDPALRQLASQELFHATTAAEQWTLGTKWREQAAALKGDDKLPLLTHAFQWMFHGLKASQLEKPALDAMTAELAKLQEEIAPKVALFLSTLPEVEVYNNGTLGKNGLLGFVSRSGVRNALVNRKASPRGICMNPTKDARSFATYALFGQYRTFVTQVGLADTSNAAYPVEFAVYGDDRLLWTSQTFEAPGPTQPCVLDVTGVNRLRIEIHGGESDGGAHCVWMDPHVWRIPLVKPVAEVEDPDRPRRRRGQPPALPVRAPR